jgi:hypothetical protein
MVSGARR